MYHKACYGALFKSGDLAKRADKAYKLLESCTVCPWNCKVNRLKDEKGVCKLGKDLVVSSVPPHHGEEPPISGSRGSGTIFLTRCNLCCEYCQNYDISQLGRGEKMSLEELAKKMLWLQGLGCHNINWVSPTHQLPQLLKSLVLACEMGLEIPIVYNTGGYDGLETLKILDGVVDIYMPDIKYSDPETALRLSKVKDYPKYNRIALKEMYRQVGTLKIDKDGVAYHGLMVRHLVLPNRLAGSHDSLSFLAKEVSPHVFLSLLAQYHPCYKAVTDPELSRRITKKEYEEVVNWALELGFDYGYFQELSSSDIFLPDFRKENPFENT